MKAINWKAEWTRTIRNRAGVFTFPEPMTLRSRKRYVRLWREINFNERFKVNLDLNEVLRDNAHRMISEAICR